MPRPDLPPQAAALVRAARGAVLAALDADAAAFATATGHLAACEPEHVRVLLGGAVRSLLEELHPDGLEADDVGAALTATLRQAAPWWPAVDGGALVVVATGALGVHDPEAEERVVTPAQVAVAAPLVVAHLVGGDRRRLDRHLDLAITEIAREQTVEMP